MKHDDERARLVIPAAWHVKLVVPLARFAGEARREEGSSLRYRLGYLPALPWRIKERVCCGSPALEEADDLGQGPARPPRNGRRGCLSHQIRSDKPGRA
jgi:hypothetical protein